MSVLFKNVLRKIAGDIGQPAIDRALSRDWHGPNGYRQAVRDDAANKYHKVPGLLNTPKETFASILDQDSMISPNNLYATSPVDQRTSVASRTAQQLRRQQPSGYNYGAMNKSFQDYGASKARYYFNNETVESFPGYSDWVNDPKNDQPSNVKDYWNNLPANYKQSVQLKDLNTITRNNVPGGNRGAGYGIG